jgi:hypothetical protein
MAVLAAGADLRSLSGAYPDAYYPMTGTGTAEDDVANFDYAEVGTVTEVDGPGFAQTVTVPQIAISATSTDLGVVSVVAPPQVSVSVSCSGVGVVPVVAASQISVSTSFSGVGVVQQVAVEQIAVSVSFSGVGVVSIVAPPQIIVSAALVSAGVVQHVSAEQISAELTCSSVGVVQQVAAGQISVSVIVLGTGTAPSVPVPQIVAAFQLGEVSGRNCWVRDMRDNPFSVVMDALWELVMSSAYIRHVVRLRNRVSFENAGTSGKDQTSTADFPEIRVVPMGGAASLLRSSSSSTTSFRFAIQVRTADINVHVMLAIRWAVFSSLAGWPQLARKLRWDGQIFVTNIGEVQIQDNLTKVTPESAGDALVGWATLWTGECSMSFTTKQLQEIVSYG